MKTVAIFEGTKPVCVQRFEGDLKVGERSVYMVDFIESLTDELSIGSLVGKVMERRNELSTYYSDVSYWNDYGQLDEFLKSVLQNANKSSLEDNEALQRIALVALSELGLASPENPEVITLVNNMVAKVDNLNESVDLMDLTLSLITKLLKSDEAIVAKARKKVTALACGLLNNDTTVKNTVKNVLPNFDRDWIMQVLQSGDVNGNAPLANVTVPKNCVFMQVGTVYNTYVLEVPKARIRVKYFDTAFEDVGHPRMLCILQVKADVILSMKLVAIPEKAKIENNMMVFAYPYSNVFSSGKVCWTGYTEKGMAENLAQVPHLFLSTTNNGHIKQNVRILFEQNSGKDFDDSDLRPMNVTLQELL